MERVVSATAARVHLGEWMRRAVEGNERIIIQREGESHVVLLSVAEYERLVRGQQQPEQWKELVDQARAQIRADLGDRQLPPVEEVLRQIREERDAQLMALH
jgi:prevent-host-death family protein